MLGLSKLQGLLALVVAAAHARAALAADGVQLVDEDDARRVLLGLTFPKHPEDPVSASDFRGSFPIFV